jgi:hypothetical protein
VAPLAETFHYRTLEIRARRWPAVIEALRRRENTFGLWLPQIGFAANEGVWITTGDAGAIDDVPDVLGSTVERLVPTVRPTSLEPPPKGGVYAHRWFEVDESDWPEFLALSEAAWPDFERSFETRVIGLFRSLDVEPPRARALLLTRYANLAAWQESRPVDATHAELAEMRARFMRRHELTKATIVRTTTLAEDPGLA